jgi:hypothetical protein
MDNCQTGLSVRGKWLRMALALTENVGILINNPPLPNNHAFYLVIYKSPSVAFVTFCKTGVHLCFICG